MTEYLRILIAARTAKMEERGASAVEYGLLIAGIAALIVAVVFIFGDNIGDLFSSTCSKLNSTTGTGTATCTSD